ncbi:MAG: Transcriptional regulator, HxlR family [Candidatus Pacebacteria bacterium GW2011_GWF2_38_9]|nr:MAG: HxlR family transcriptional regulator [candidate division TM6 bacterium GW2011_GWF2_28_16]KKQ10334.1 MAG: Transcriptional regulator, HxlR family [Candidatus Pacebacteria bacterium GW2011_GWF1_36_5]KKQ88698.1 MAG: Transcriptional regulator, HxlR family [Candidatus Pacebacteria bacterium GW2011_GWF2_38_9]HAZ73657.1 transcriptional regulator [Candidatus Paceibacterota bacterium]
MKKNKCPLQEFCNELGGKWNLVILWHLTEEQTGFNDLKKTIGPISAKVLSEKLKSLKKNRLITRKTLRGNPPHVKYELTKKGQSLLPIIKILHDWGDKNL